MNGILETAVFVIGAILALIGMATVRVVAAALGGLFILRSIMRRAERIQKEANDRMDAFLKEHLGDIEPPGSPPN